MDKSSRFIPLETTRLFVAPLHHTKSLPDHIEQHQSQACSIKATALEHGDGTYDVLSAGRGRSASEIASSHVGAVFEQRQALSAASTAPQGESRDLIASSSTSQSASSLCTRELQAASLLTASRALALYHSDSAIPSHSGSTQASKTTASVPVPRFKTLEALIAASGALEIQTVGVAQSSSASTDSSKSDPPTPVVPTSSRERIPNKESSRRLARAAQQEMNPHNPQVGLGAVASASSSSLDSVQMGRQGSGAYQCPNCSKSFARDDLLRRHLAREARAQAQPALDRQKSCYECARSKARCDLEVPMCGRCRSRGKQCVYGARSGNPNVQKSMRETEELGGTPAPQWNGPMGDAGWHGAMPMGQGSQSYSSSSTDDYESSDENQAWAGSLGPQAGSFRPDRHHSSSSDNSTSFAFREQLRRQEQQAAQTGPYGAPYPHPSYGVPHDSSNLVRGFSGSGGRSIDTNVSRVNPEDDEVTPISRQTGGTSNVMGPPLVAPSRIKDESASSQRPHVPRLLTGARMPRPPEAGQTSARPLFSAQLDLSGWLEEPVVPSPLYRMGPSLSSIGSSAFNLPTPVNPNTSQSLNPSIVQQQQQQQQQNLTSSRGANDDTDMGVGEGSSSSNPSQLAARNWWAASQENRGEIDSQTVAQVCAGHFTLYPALVVLPDPTSPVPPLFHRPWLAQTRLQTPAVFAKVRVALAAYQVRLPASEAMVWDMISSQARQIVSSVDSLAQASDMEVFANTSALWFLIILLLMSSDPNSGVSIGGDIVDTSLIALSHLARLLQQRVRGMEQAQQMRRSSNTPTPFFEWGFEETARRTLFACYALFVLQRFRETSPQLQSQLADVDLVLDVKLPASASEFEAGSELEWRAAQHIKITDAGGSTIAASRDLTLRGLLDARRALLGGDGNKGTLGGSRTGQLDPSELRRIQSYFDRHDDFTNVCLTTAFALDTHLA